MLLIFSFNPSCRLQKKNRNFRDAHSEYAQAPSANPETKKTTIQAAMS